MRTGQRGKRWTTAGALALAFLMISGLGAVTRAAGPDDHGATPAAAAHDEPTISVNATGTATVPPDGALLMFVFRWNDLAAVPGATGGMGGADSAAMAGGPGPSSPPVTEADLQPVIDVLTAGGIPASVIEITLTPANALTASFGPGTAQVIATIDRAAVANLATVVPAVVDAALAANLLTDQTGIGYLVEDCAAVEIAALRVAVERARTQAEQMAEVLGQPLGELLSATRQPGYNAYSGGAACGDPVTAADVRSGKFYLPPYNPAAPAEFEINVAVSLTYALGETESAE